MFRAAMPGLMESRCICSFKHLWFKKATSEIRKRFCRICSRVDGQDLVSSSWGLGKWMNSKNLLEQNGGSTQPEEVLKESWPVAQALEHLVVRVRAAIITEICILVLVNEWFGELRWTYNETNEEKGQNRNDDDTFSDAKKPFTHANQLFGRRIVSSKNISPTHESCVDNKAYLYLSRLADAGFVSSIWRFVKASSTIKKGLTAAP